MQRFHFIIERNNLRMKAREGMEKWETEKETEEKGKGKGRG